MKVVDVAAGLVFRDGKLLITQRPEGGHLEGLWEFPGGKREPHESFEQCLERELMEELGIEVEIHEVVESITHHYPEKSVHLRFFRCTWRRNEPRALGCPAFQWITGAEIPNYSFPAADARLIEKLLSLPGLWR